VEDDCTFNIVRFMKSKLINKLITHLVLVIHIFFNISTPLRIFHMMLPSKHGRVCVYDMVMMHNFMISNFVKSL
jgi:hypothetical protein